MYGQFTEYILQSYVWEAILRKATKPLNDSELHCRSEEKRVIEDNLYENKNNYLVQV